MYTVTFEERNTGNEQEVECTQEQYAIAMLLAYAADDVSANDATLTDKEVGRIVDTLYERLAWWDTEKLMLV
tara:strand:+ start:231 stop:446 length:216 start_codon:yes stop_codon:yes gene_type:complete